MQPPRTVDRIAATAGYPKVVHTDEVTLSDVIFLTELPEAYINLETEEDKAAI